MEDSENNEIARRVSEICAIIQSGKIKTLWLRKRTDAEDFPPEFNGLFSAIPLPKEEPNIWTKNFTILPDPKAEMMKSLGFVDDWIWNVILWKAPGYKYTHDYSYTNMKDVYIHRMCWEGNAWGGCDIFISINIPEEDFTKFNNIAPEYKDKFREIREAAGSKEPRILLLLRSQGKEPDLKIDILAEAIFPEIVPKDGGVPLTHNYSSTDFSHDMILRICDKRVGGRSKNSKRGNYTVRTNWSMSETIFPGAYCYEISASVVELTLFGKKTKLNDFVGNIIFLTFNIPLAQIKD